MPSAEWLRVSLQETEGGETISPWHDIELKHSPVSGVLSAPIVAKSTPVRAG